jgi:hypothetical protein
MRVDSATVTLEELTSLLGAPNIKTRHQNWIHSFRDSNEEPLEKQLSRAESFVTQHLPRLAGVGDDANVSFQISGTPKSGQDGFALSGTLIGLLGKIGATILVDTYSDW